MAPLMTAGLIAASFLLPLELMWVRKAGFVKGANSGTLSRDEKG